jgi:hypothetical protein
MVGQLKSIESSSKVAQTVQSESRVKCSAFRLRRRHSVQREGARDEGFCAALNGKFGGAAVGRFSKFSSITCSQETGKSPAMLRRGRKESADKVEGDTRTHVLDRTLHWEEANPHRVVNPTIGVTRPGRGGRDPRLAS